MAIKMIITCDTGFERILIEELKNLITWFNLIEITGGRVFIEVNKHDVVNVLRSRIANNVYLLLHVENNVTDLNTIYKVMKNLNFTKIIGPTQTFAIRPNRIGTHSFTSIDIGKAAGQAVIDDYLESHGVRLKVDLDNPDVEIYVELNNDKLIVALPLTKCSLHARGYKVFAHPAGLKPTIASALLKIAGWDYDNTILDPMCGGGTIVIEAAIASKGIEIPCISESSINLNLLNNLYPEVVESIQNLCSKKLRRDVNRGLIGIDINPRFIEGAIINAKNAGVDDITIFFVGDLKEMIPKIKSVEREFGAELTTAVFNPPYGYRMKRASLTKLYTDTLRTLISLNFKVLVFITSAIRVSEEVLIKFSNINIQRLKVMHGTLPSYVYKLECY